MKRYMLKHKLGSVLIYVVTAFVLVMALFSITDIYIRTKNEIRQEMLESSIEEIQNLSSQIKYTVHYEVEDFVYMLEIIRKSADLDFASLEKSRLALQNVEAKGTFTDLGIINTRGEGIDTNGRIIKMDVDKVIQGLSKLPGGESLYHISEVVSQKDRAEQEITVAIPVYEDGRLEGILFGRQPLDKISAKVNSYLENGLCFQIIDNNGDYIDPSFNICSQSTDDMSIWEELEKHKYGLEHGYTATAITEDISKGKKGIFFFRDEEGGRYVVYEPLEINKWYIISVITEAKLDAKANELQKIADDALYDIIFLILFITCTITAASFYIYTSVKNESDKNRIFKLLANKTRNIFFEIRFSEKACILYDSEDYKKTDTFPLWVLSPESMLAKNTIRTADLEHYKGFYDDLMLRKNIDRFTIELGIKNTWRWYRISTMTFKDDYIIGILEDITEEQDNVLEIMRISEKSKYDFLTTLYNRETFEREFDRFVSTGMQQELLSALFILDLDNFKKINDNFGHNIGDMVLKEASEALKLNLRGPDFLGRLGGDEFIVLIQNASSLEDISKIAERLGEVLVKTYSKADTSITVTCSIGIALIKAEDTFNDAYEKADKALYKVKTAGKNSYHIEE